MYIVIHAIIKPVRTCSVVAALSEGFVVVGTVLGAFDVGAVVGVGDDVCTIA